MFSLSCSFSSFDHIPCLHFTPRYMYMSSRSNVICSSYSLQRQILKTFLGIGLILLWLQISPHSQHFKINSPYCLQKFLITSDLQDFPVLENFKMKLQNFLDFLGPIRTLNFFPVCLPDPHSWLQKATTGGIDEDRLSIIVNFERLMFKVLVPLFPKGGWIVEVENSQNLLGSLSGLINFLVIINDWKCFNFLSM